MSLPRNYWNNSDCRILGNYMTCISIHMSCSWLMFLEVSETQPWKSISWIKQGYRQDKGYFLEVDLEYPEELHDFHDTYPCAPEKLKIEEKYLSDHQKELGKKCGAKFGSEKLCLTLKHKEKYILHYRNLK